MEISKMKPDYTLKYIIVGNSAVGKTNIIYIDLPKINLILNIKQQ